MMMDGKGKLEEKDCGESERGITRVIGEWRMKMANRYPSKEGNLLVQRGSS